MRQAAILAVLVIPLGLDLYLPTPIDNPLTAAKVVTGRRLFSDRRLSRDGSVACASCHDPAAAFADGRTVSAGVFGRRSSRNAPALINRGYGRLFFWDGRVKSLEEQVLEPIQNPNEMDLTLEEATRRTGIDARTMASALATYVRSILSGDAPYDRFIHGSRHALTPEQQAGMRVFRGKGNCVTCHIPPTFSDEQLHNTGVAWREPLAGSPRFADPGAGRGTFKTPALRDVARTAPYMHDGSIATIERVIDFYDAGGRPNPALDPEVRPLNLSAEEKSALAAFLGSLSGTITEGVDRGRRRAQLRRSR
jgi:cytochrome c peroxidase